ncbi:MAG: hypothetical protein ACJ72M_04720 [Propionibacteriaceae bacterium]
MGSVPRNRRSGRVSSLQRDEAGAVGTLLLATSGVSMLVLLTGFVMSTTAVALTGGLAVWFVTLPAAGVVLAAIFAIPT